LVSAKSQNTGEALISLPEGFKYTVFGRTGEEMSDGIKTPGAHDGMAAFDHKGKIRLVRNHEMRTPAAEGKAASESHAYDKKAAGGTSTLEINPETRLPEKVWLSLSGTLVNCAGGPTPWGSWITCEETVVGAAQGYDEEHGYCFEVPASLDVPAPATPIVGMGRFVHEAIAVDPKTRVVYLTEDRGASGLFRFIPTGQAMTEGGRLQMLAVKGKPKLDTRTGQTMGSRFDAYWVDIDVVDPASDTPNLESALYREGLEKGGATFARLEGCWHGNDSIYVTCTNGGDKKLGQVFRYIPGSADEGVLELVFESPDSSIMKAPDNLCVTPKGALAICEDGDGPNYIRGITREGKAFDFIRNDLNGSEFAGSAFSADGKTLFFNIQNPGMTIAVWGDFSRGVF
jgi:secreted PhoX family phosphatase